MSTESQIEHRPSSATPKLPQNFRLIRLRLAREHGHPEGDAHHGYDFLAPLKEDGHIDAEGYRVHASACRVRRFRPGEVDFALYRFRGGPGGEAVTKVFRPPAYPYRAMDWYRLPLAAGAAGWTEPFVDHAGGDIPMVTYAVPFRRGGEPAGVATVDLSAAYFGRLGEWVRELDFGPESYGVVLSRAGVVVSHPDPACDFAAHAAAGLPVLHAEQLSPGDEAFRVLAGRMLGDPAGTGSAADPASGRPATWVFHRVRSPGWTFADVVPDEARPAVVSRTGDRP